MRRTIPDAIICARRSRTAWPETPSIAPTASYGRGTSGNPAWVAAISARSKSVSVVIAALHRQPQADEILALAREREHRQAGLGFDRGEHPVGRRGILGGDDEPHVQRVLAAIVVRNLRVRVDTLGDRVEPVLGNGDRREHQAPARALDLEQRSEADRK